MWCCSGSCREREPYFGFIWVKTDREPNSSDSMWCDGCEHEFERYGDPKLWLTEWECVTIFNQFVITNEIRIKSNQIRAMDFNDIDTFAVDLDTQPLEICNEQYINYDAEIGSFINLKEFYPNLYADLQQENRTVCIICFRSVAKENVIEHLNSCSGLTFSINQSDLPILMINEN